MSCKQQIDALTRRRGLQSGIAVAILLVSAAMANGATKYWSGGTGDWSSGTYWGTPPATPAAGDTAYIGNGGTAQITITDNIATLYVGSSQSTRPGTGTVTISSTGNLVVGSGAGTTYIGSATNGGTITQSGGGASIGTLVFGGSTFGMTGGTYNLNGGALPWDRAELAAEHTAPPPSILAAEHFGRAPISVPRLA